MSYLARAYLLLLFLITLLNIIKGNKIKYELRKTRSINIITNKLLFPLTLLFK